MKTLRRRGPTRLAPRPTKSGLNLVEDNKLKGRFVENVSTSSRYEVREKLTFLLQDQTLPASARVTAARTLAEIEGLIGRHQAAPERDTTTPPHALSRDELVTELERLRTLHGLGLIS